MPKVRTDYDFDAVAPSERVIYQCFIKAVNGFNPVASVLRTAKTCGVSRNRVMDVIRKINPEFSTRKDDSWLSEHLSKNF